MPMWRDPIRLSEKKRAARHPIMITLIEARIERNWTQETLADKICVSRRTISRYESGAHWPSLDLVVTWAKALEIDIIAVPRGVTRDALW